MNTFSNFKFYVDACKYMRCFLNSMNIMGINNILHDITFGDGQVSMLTPDIKMVEFYSKTKTPLVYTDKSGRFLKEGVYLNKVIESQYPQYSRLKPLSMKAARKENLNYGENYLHYVVREIHCQHMYTLFFDLSYIDFLHFIINNGNLIKETIAEYHHRAKDIIQESKLRENRIFLPNMSELFVPSERSMSDESVDHVYLSHNKTSLTMHISSQRGQCLLHLAQGKSTKEIAQAMALSPKTVEHYLALLRSELGCDSSRSLIAVYGEQLKSFCHLLN